MTILRCAVDGGVDVLAGGAAVVVGEDGGAVEDVGLFGVVGRHDHVAGGEALLQGFDDGGVCGGG